MYSEDAHLWHTLILPFTSLLLRNSTPETTPSRRLQQLVRRERTGETSNTRKIQTGWTIDFSFGEHPPTAGPHLHVENERAVRPRSRGRRPLPVCAVGAADAKPLQTAASNSGYSFSRTFSTSCTSPTSIVAAVSAPRRSEDRAVGAFC